MGNCHFKNWSRIDGAQVTAAVGCSDPDRMRAAEWGLPYYTSIREACGGEAVDLVDICAPTFLHKPLVLEALSQKKHTITEKPMALSVQDALQMFAAADQAGVQLYVAQVLQFTREVEVLRGVVKDGRYGKALDAHFERLSACPKWTQDSWMLEKEKSGLIPYDLHIHDLDVIISLFGKPDGIETVTCGGADKAYKEHYRFLYSWADGLHVSAEAAWFNACIPFTARWRVYFERGCLIAEGGSVCGYGADGEKTDFDISEAVTVSVGTNLPPNGWFYRELSHLMHCAEEGKPSPLVPREQVIAVLETVQKLDQ
ncbi:MAG: Gfo/Idh/MocA family oxidoreductase [Clostridia bacterium]|nr:Gfo/Idh/MocA family oxidoreductase [Clostridia bacterium]